MRRQRNQKEIFCLYIPKDLQDEFYDEMIPALDEVSKSDERSSNRTIIRAIKQFLVSRGKVTADKPRKKKSQT